MPRIAVNGGSGDLARRITALLLEELRPEDLILVTRTPEAITERARQGAVVARGDFQTPDSLEAAYRGADALMLISGNDVTQRIPQHRNAIEAAKRAGVKHIVYTSVAGIHPRNPTPSAGDHIVTERDLYASGLSFTALRDQTYAEVFPTIEAPRAAQTGRWEQVGGAGRIAPVSKRDIARCAVRCLLDPGLHGGATYEITGPELVTFRDIARLTAEIYGVPIEYIEITPSQLYAKLDALGVPRKLTPNMKPHPDFQLWFSDEMVNAHVAFQAGYHAILSDHVEFITGRRPHSLREVFAFGQGRAYGEA